MTERLKVADDIYMVPWSEGNGQIRREIWVDNDGRVIRYLLAYINPDILPGDGGRVLGYDLDAGVLHHHRMGTVAPLELSSIEAVEERFALEWDLLPKQDESPVPLVETGPGWGCMSDESDGYSETKGMQLTITKGIAVDFFRRGRELARKLDRGERLDPEKVVIFGDRHDLCYSQLPKR